MKTLNLRVEQFGNYWTVVNFADGDGTKQYLGFDNRFHEGLDICEIRTFSKADAELKLAQLEPND